MAANSAVFVPYPAPGTRKAGGPGIEPQRTSARPGRPQRPIQTAESDGRVHRPRSRAVVFLPAGATSDPARIGWRPPGSGDECPVDRASALVDDEMRARGGVPRARKPRMARVSTYLNFQGQAEEAFAFYATTFGTQVTMLSRYSDMPAAGPGELPAEEQNLVLHAELP